MRISDWSSDVCSSDLRGGRLGLGFGFLLRLQLLGPRLGAALGLLAGLGLVRVVARGALTHARRIEEARNAVGLLRADTEPMVRAIGVALDALLVVLGEKRVVIADPLDEAAVARAARIGDDDAVIGTLLGAAARQTNAECHCVPS